MLRKVNLLFLSVLLVCLCQAYAEEGWQVVKGSHFIIYFTNDEAFAKNVAEKAEVYYEKIASDLGYARHSGFWTWDKRVRIYIYPDHKSYLLATGEPDWSYGMAEYTKKEIYSFIWSKGFLESLLPHEIAHLIFRDFVGFKGEVPLWLDEGVAQWAEIPKRQYMKELVKQKYENSGLLSLDDMMNIDIRKIIKSVYIRANLSKAGDKGLLFLSGDELVNTYYIEAFSLVSFFIEKYGSELFVQFCRELRDGKKFEDALSCVYSIFISNLAELSNQWRRFIEEGG